MRSLIQTAEAYNEKLIETIQSLNLADLGAIQKLIEEVERRQGTIFTCGNGGSASTASHFVCDWTKMYFEAKQKKLKTFCLNDNVNLLTAYSNDTTYQEAYSRILAAYAAPGDVLICVSGSGNSPNVVQAIEAAKALDVHVIGVVGFDGGKVKQLSDQCFHVESSDMQICEDIHLSFGHWMMRSLID